jgi:ankyrin repeat protein
METPTTGVGSGHKSPFSDTFCELMLASDLPLVIQDNQVVEAPKPKCKSAEDLHKELQFRCYCSLGHIDLVRQVLKDKTFDVNCKNESGNTSLHAAAKHGHSHVVEELLCANAIVDALNHKYETPLFCAVDKGRVNVVHQLLYKRASSCCVTFKNETPLGSAIYSGYLEIVEQLLNAQLLIKYDDSEKSRLYQMAIRLRYYDIARALVERDVFPTSLKSKDVKNLLFWAVARGHLNIFKKMVIYSTDLDARSVEGRTLLFEAANYNCIALVREILRHNVDVSIGDYLDYTPLYMAINHRNSAMAELLLEHKQDVNKLFRSGLTLLDVAANGGMTFVMQLLLLRGANIVGYRGFSSLLCAVKSEHKSANSAAALLLKCGVDPNYSSDKSENLLVIAASQGKTYLVRLLLHYRAHVNKFPNGCLSPLHQAAKEDFNDIAKLLLNAGANIESVGFNGHTPLSLACYYGRLSVATYLTECGASCATRDIFGNSPLHYASNWGFVDLVNLLVDHQAVVNSTNWNNETALYRAALEGNILAVKSLVNHNADVNICTLKKQSPLIVATIDGSLPLVRYLLEHNANVNWHGEHGNTALHEAAIHGHLHIVANLIYEWDADINAKNNEKKTPLLSGYKGEYTPIISLLLKNKADVRCADFTDHTIFHRAVYKNDLDFVYRLIMSESIDINAQAANESTPLMVAASLEYPEMMKLLLKFNADPDITTCTGHTAYDKAIFFRKDSIARLLSPYQLEKDKMKFAEDSTNGKIWKKIHHGEDYDELLRGPDVD